VRPVRVRAGQVAIQTVKPRIKTVNVTIKTVKTQLRQSRPIKTVSTSSRPSFPSVSARARSQLRQSRPDYGLIEGSQGQILAFIKAVKARFWPWLEPFF